MSLFSFLERTQNNNNLTTMETNVVLLSHLPKHLSIHAKLPAAAVIGTMEVNAEDGSARILNPAGQPVATGLFTAGPEELTTVVCTNATGSQIHSSYVEPVILEITDTATPPPPLAAKSSSIAKEEDEVDDIFFMPSLLVAESAELSQPWAQQPPEVHTALLALCHPEVLAAMADTAVPNELKTRVANVTLRTVAGQEIVKKKITRADRAVLLRYCAQVPEAARRPQQVTPREGSGSLFLQAMAQSQSSAPRASSASIVTASNDNDGQHHQPSKRGREEEVESKTKPSKYPTLALACERYGMSLPEAGYLQGYSRAQLTLEEVEVHPATKAQLLPDAEFAARVRKFQDTYPLYEAMYRDVQRHNDVVAMVREEAAKSTTTTGDDGLVKEAAAWLSNVQPEVTILARRVENLHRGLSAGRDVLVSHVVVQAARQK